MEYTDPKITIDLLAALAEHSMSDEHLRRLHHLGDTSNNVYIDGHRNYSRQRRRFRPGGGNAATAKRLAVCLQRLQSGASWELAIQHALAEVPFSGSRTYLPTSDEEDLEHAVSALAAEDPPPTPPAGQLVPRIVADARRRFERDPSVAAWVEHRANGRCEHCRAAAPFARSDGRPFLEIHHVVRLADGGSDRITNAVALCPNCHRLLHHSEDRHAARERLYALITELQREAPAPVR